MAIERKKKSRENLFEMCFLLILFRKEKGENDQVCRSLDVNFSVLLNEQLQIDV